MSYKCEFMLLLMNLFTSDVQRHSPFPINTLSLRYEGLSILDWIKILINPSHPPPFPAVFLHQC